MNLRISTTLISEQNKKQISKIWITDWHEPLALVYGLDSSQVTMIRSSRSEIGFGKGADKRETDFKNYRSLTKLFKHEFGMADNSMGQKRDQGESRIHLCCLWQK